MAMYERYRGDFAIHTPDPDTEIGIATERHPHGKSVLYREMHAVGDGLYVPVANRGHGLNRYQLSVSGCPSAQGEAAFLVPTMGHMGRQDLTVYQELLDAATKAERTGEPTLAEALRKRAGTMFQRIAMPTRKEAYQAITRAKLDKDKVTHWEVKKVIEELPKRVLDLRHQNGQFYDTRTSWARRDS